MFWSVSGITALQERGGARPGEVRLKASYLKELSHSKCFGNLLTVHHPGSPILS